MQAIYYNYYPNFLYVNQYTFSRKWIYPVNRIPFSLLRYIVKGSADFILNGEHYDVKKDDVFYIPQGSELACTAKEDFTFISIRFIDSIQLQSAAMLQELWNIPTGINYSDKPEMYEWFHHIWQSAISKNNYKMLEIRGYLNLICASLAQRAVASENRDDNKQEKAELEEDQVDLNSFCDIKTLQLRAEKTSIKNDPRITALLDYIISHPDENFNSTQLCKMADVSESTLRRLFKIQTGKTIYEYVLETKMNNAARRLLITADTIETIAYDLGYESPSYFSKCFKSNFGVSPKEYRKLAHES